MAHQVQFEHSSVSDLGRVRALNEDALVVIPEAGIALLADGMGGHQAGEVASQLAIDVCAQALTHIAQSVTWSANDCLSSGPMQSLRNAIICANAVIFDTARNNLECAGMGTTLVAVLLYDEQLIVGHVGDSRAYRMRDATLERITRDHSLVQEQVDAGRLSHEQARHASNRHLVTRALGIAPTVDPEVHGHRTQPGDLYLLCSDGLTDMVEDQDIAEILHGAATGLPLHCLTTTLVARANALGGMDNISVILLKTDREPPGPPQTSDGARISIR
ncbi:MAG: Stp1/IreP family PP2C-type Ser/Thr phosphatase [Burkholderiaceae bacterium]